MIHLSQVTVTFNNHNVLEDVNLTVKSGEFVFLVGQTGSGKSTLLKLMYMDVPPNKGTISIGKYNSSNVERSEIPYLRRSLGIIFQDFQLLEDRNVYENIAFTLHVTGVKRADIKKKVLRILGEVGLTHQRNKMPHELSGGEQQRIAIARALVNNPQVLLADEPTGNLDPATSFEILNLLKSINAGGTAVVMATHNYDLVRKLNERIVQVKDGKLYDVVIK
ncbi:MAG TPA: cell division ATP-binding protein FtsE [Bacteroidota bacterium]|jgi:cell division transport system ATP-binding protein